MDQIQSQNSVSQNNQESQDIIDEEIEERKQSFESSKKLFDEYVLELKEKANDVVDLEQFKDQFKFKTKLKNLSFDEIKASWERVQNKFFYSKQPKNWSEDELNIMIWLVIKFSEHTAKDIEEIEDESFEKLAKMMPFKDGTTFKHKWLQMKQINLSQIPWTKEEDDLLTQIYLDFKKQDKQNKWSDISKLLENKTKIFRRGKQCRERWNNYLDPDMNRGNWSDDEDFKLLSIALEIGSTQWSSLAKRLSKRTENAVKNRFKSLMKKERKERIKNGHNMKSAESLTEHIDKEVLTQIIDKLKQKIAMKNIQLSQENNQINSTNPGLFQMYFQPQQNFQQMHPATPNASFLQQHQQQINFSILNNHPSSKSPRTSPDHSPSQKLSQKVQQIGIKPKEEDLQNQLNSANGFNQFTQAQFQYQQLQQKQQLQQNQVQQLNDQTYLQQSQALQQQLQNLNLNGMSPMNHQILKNQLLQQQMLQQQAAQQQPVNQAMTPINALQGGSNTPQIQSLIQSLQNQAMQNHSNLVQQSPQFINKLVPNSNNINQQLFTQVNSSNLLNLFFEQFKRNRSINGVTIPNSFSDAINVYSGVNQTQNGGQLNTNLTQAQTNGLIGAQSTPFIQLANQTSIFQNQVQNQMSGLSPSGRFQVMNAGTGGQYTPKTSGLITSNNNLSCGNTPSSSRNKRSDKPNMFSDYERLQKLRISENEELEQKEIQQKSEKQIQKKAQKVFMNAKIEEEEEEEQNAQPQKNTYASQKIYSKQEVDQDNNENLADSPILSQNNLNQDQDSDSNSEANRIKRHLLNLQSQSGSFNKFRKDDYGNSIIKPQKLPISPYSGLLQDEETKQSPSKLSNNGQQKIQNQFININSAHNSQMQNGLNPINFGSLNNLGSLNDINNIPTQIPISQNQFNSNHQLSFQQLDYLSQQQKQVQSMYSPSHQKQNSNTPMNFSIYSQMNPVSPSNSLNLLSQKQFQQQQQQQQQQQLQQTQLQNGLTNLNIQSNPQNDLQLISNILPNLSLQQIEFLQQQIQQQQIAKRSLLEQQQNMLQQQAHQNSAIQKLLSQQQLGVHEGIRIDLSQTNFNQS